MEPRARWGDHGAKGPARAENLVGGGGQHPGSVYLRARPFAPARPLRLRGEQYIRPRPAGPSSPHLGRGASERHPGPRKSWAAGCPGRPATGRGLRVRGSASDSAARPGPDREGGSGQLGAPGSGPAAADPARVLSWWTQHQAETHPRPRGPQVKAPPRSATPGARAGRPRRALRAIGRSRGRWRVWPGPVELGSCPRTPKSLRAHPRLKVRT